MSGGEGQFERDLRRECGARIEPDEPWPRMTAYVRDAFDRQAAAVLLTLSALQLRGRWHFAANYAGGRLDKVTRRAVGERGEPIGEPEVLWKVGDPTAPNGPPAAWLIEGGRMGPDDPFIDGACVSEADAVLAVQTRGEGATRTPLVRAPWALGVASAAVDTPRAQWELSGGRRADRVDAGPALLELARYFRGVGDLWEGPDGCGTPGTDLCQRIASDLAALARVPLALGLTQIPTPYGVAPPACITVEAIKGLEVVDLAPGAVVALEPGGGVPDTPGAILAAVAELIGRLPGVEMRGVFDDAGGRFIMSVRQPADAP